MVNTFESYLPETLFNYSESMSQIVDDALTSATEAQKTTSKEADKTFKMAINALTDYIREHRVNIKMDVAKCMEEAKAKDKLSLKPFNNLKDKLRVRDGPLKDLYSVAY
jgi:hypothetical protein